MWFYLTSVLVTSAFTVFSRVLECIIEKHALGDKYRRFVSISVIISLVLGIILLAVGSFALNVKQPWHIAFTFLVPGFCMTILYAALLNNVCKRYRSGKISLESDSPTRP